MIAQGMPPEGADAVLAARGFGTASPGATFFPTVEQITGRPPHTYREWVDAHLDAFRQHGTTADYRREHHDASEVR
jgi:hypothetical protein